MKIAEFKLDNCKVFDSYWIKAGMYDFFIS